MHAKRKTFSFLYKMTEYEVIINAIKVRLEVMRDRTMKKMHLVPDRTTNKPKKSQKNPPNQNQQITSQKLLHMRKLLGIKQKPKLYQCINSWVTLMLNPQSIQSKNIPVYTKQCPFCAETSTPRKQNYSLEQGQFENESC